MSSLFSVGGSIDIPAGRRSGRARGKFGRMAGEIVKAIGDSSPTVGLAVEPRGTFNPGINPPSIDENKSGRIGGMIGGTSPIPGVSGHEYLNDPKYAEHRRDYYGKKKRVDKFGNPITKPEEDVKGKGRRRRSAERDRRRKVRKPSFRKDFDLSDRRKRTRRRMEGGNIPRDEQQPVGSGSTPYMPKVKFEDLIGIGKGKNKTNMPTFGKMELQ